MRTDRWKPHAGLEDAAARLENVPIDFGEWRGKRQKLDDEGFTRFGIKNYFACEYRHARTGFTVSVLLVCGRSGPISVHTPDVCYKAIGFEPSGDPELREVDFENDQ